MQTIVSSSLAAMIPSRAPTQSGIASSAYTGFQIIRRNGSVVAFEPNKIAVALMKAFLAVHGTQGAASASVRETVDSLTTRWRGPMSCTASAAPRNAHVRSSRQRRRHRCCTWSTVASVCRWTLAHCRR